MIQFYSMIQVDLPKSANAKLLIIRKYSCYTQSFTSWCIYLKTHHGKSPKQIACVSAYSSRIKNHESSNGNIRSGTTKLGVAR